MFLGRKFYIVLIITILFVSSNFGQTESFSINGKTTDPNGAIISNTTVVLRNMANGTEQITQTDNEGSYAFQSIIAGKYRVSANSAGFSTVSKEINVKDGNNLIVDFLLSVGDIGESVTVTATRTQVSTSDTAVSVSVLDRAELERKNVNTIGDAFRNLPGVSTVNEGSFQVRPRIRGLDSNRILVLVDGERLNNARTSTSQSGIELGLIGTEQIETLEVVRGSGSVLYGTDALGGTVNIITKDAPRRTDKGLKLGATFNGFYSSNDTGRRGSVALNGSSKFFSFRLSQSLERYNNYSTGNLDGRTFDGVTLDNEVINSQSHGSNTQVTTRFFFDDNNDLRLNYARRRAGNIGVPTLVGVFNAFFPDSDRDKFNARYESRNVNKYLARLSGSFHIQKQKRNFTNILTIPAFPPFFPGLENFSETITDTDSIGFDLQSNWILGSKNFLTAGFSFFRDSNKDRRLEESRIPFVVQDRSKSVPDSNFGSFAFFAQDDFELTKRFRIIGGVRIERFSSNSKATDGFGLPATLTANQIEDLGLTGLNTGLNVDQTTLTGDIGGVFKITDEVSLSGRIGRSYRVPNLFERFFTGAGSVGGFVVGNPNLNPESGFNFDASVKVRTTKFASSFTYFNNTYRNFLSNELAFDRRNCPILIVSPGTIFDDDNCFVVSSPPGRNPVEVFQTINIGRARIQGFEADLEVPIKLGLGFLTPSGNISYLRGDDLENDEPLNTITPLKTVLNIRWTNLLASYYVDFSTRIVNKQTRLSQSFLNTNEGPESGFLVSDIGGGYTFKNEGYRVSFNLGIKNLFNRFYQEQFVFAPARGRSFVIGTTFDIK